MLFYYIACRPIRSDRPGSCRPLPRHRESEVASIMEGKNVLRKIFGLLCTVMLSLSLTPLCALAEPASGGVVLKNVIADVDSDGIPQYTIYGENVPLQNGTYWYKLMYKETGSLVFDNYLLVAYQGVNGTYSLHYAMPQSDDHQMLVNGSFDNILVTSPLLSNAVTSRITEDNYYYTLDLKTREGFTASNKLQYKYNGIQRGYQINYAYDKASNTQTVDVLDLYGNKVSQAVRNQVITAMKYLYNTYIASAPAYMSGLKGRLLPSSTLAWIR